MAFFQTPPELGNQYTTDRVLQSYLGRVLGPELLASAAPQLSSLGALAGADLFRFQLADRENEPVLTQWDAWGQRVDRVEVSPLWQRAAQLAVEYGLIALPYEKKQGALSRPLQFALAYLFDASTDVYTCPLAMTDGAAKTLLAHRNPANQALVDRAVGRLTSRDPVRAWTSGQWMTERTGGSDVGLTETVARPDPSVAGQHRLYGTKWFTSAVTSQMALTLARPEGNGPGGRGLALFYVELRDQEGQLQHIQVNRLKDKLGTRKVPTAELTLDGTPAIALVGLEGGVKKISPMLTITRTWNAIGAAAGMRRCLALARDYGRRRVAFGASLADKPLHQETLADLQAESEVGFQLAFRCAELLGREESGVATDRERLTLRLLTPLAKLVTGKQVVAVASETLEVFGGAGYVEDTGLPRLLRDAQVLPIWEGTTNVLSLDTLRAVGDGEALVAMLADAEAHAASVRDARLGVAARRGLETLQRAAAWLASAQGSRGGQAGDRAAVEAGARGFALTLGRSYGLLLQCHQAQWSLDHERDRRAALAAERFARRGLDLLRDADPEARHLANDEPLLA